MKYSVVFSSYTERHYIKTFAKRYPGAWEKTLKALTIQFTSVDLLFETSIAETICVSADNDIRICKTEFKIVGTDLSRHASGYRCIIAIHASTETVHVLLVYGKTNVAGDKETAWWQRVIRDTYPDYRELMP
jgi:hypothetical protein